MATTFHQFDELPLELQHKIWEFALLQPRYVEIFLGHSAKQRNKITSATRRIDCYFSANPCPPLLHTCRTSRDLAQRQYTVLFNGVKVTEELILAGLIYFNPEIDTIYCHEDEIPDRTAGNWPAIQLLTVVFDRGILRPFLCLGLENRNLRRVDLYMHDRWLDGVAHKLRETELECRIPQMALFDRDSGELHCEVGPTYDGPEVRDNYDVSESSDSGEEEDYDYDVDFGCWGYHGEREEDEDSEEDSEEDE